MLAAGNQAHCYVISREARTLPHYIRLGKFMSKVRVNNTEVSFETVDLENQSIPFLLNPADFSKNTRMSIFDMVNVPPVPLVRNAVLSGTFYQISKSKYLPAGMAFGVEEVS